MNDFHKGMRIGIHLYFAVSFEWLEEIKRTREYDRQRKKRKYIYDRHNILYTLPFIDCVYMESVSVVDITSTHTYAFGLCIASYFRWNSQLIYALHKVSTLLYVYGMCVCSKMFVMKYILYSCACEPLMRTSWKPFNAFVWEQRDLCSMCMLPCIGYVLYLSFFFRCFWQMVFYNIHNFQLFTHLSCCFWAFMWGYAMRMIGKCILPKYIRARRAVLFILFKRKLRKNVKRVMICFASPIFSMNWCVFVSVLEFINNKKRNKKNNKLYLWFQ